MVDPLRRAIEETRRMQDRRERAQYEVYDRLWETEEALSNRVRFFAVGVLAVSWGLLVQEQGTQNSNFDMLTVLGAAVMSVVSLVCDFLYISFRRWALIHAARNNPSQVDGSGPGVGLARMANGARILFFCLAATMLVFAAITALLPVIMSGGR